MSERIEVTNGAVTIRVVAKDEDYWRERGFGKPQPRPKPAAKRPTTRRKPAAKKPGDDE